MVKTASNQSWASWYFCSRPEHARHGSQLRLVGRGAACSIKNLGGDAGDGVRFLENGEEGGSDLSPDVDCGVNHVAC
jgi:hypothetical protein